MLSHCLSFLGDILLNVLQLVAKIAAIDVLHVIRIPFMFQIPYTIQILLYMDYSGVCPE